MLHFVQHDRGPDALHKTQSRTLVPRPTDTCMPGTCGYTGNDEWALCGQRGTMQQKGGQRRGLKKALLICALGVGILLGPVGAWWMARYWYVERAVRAFQSNPSQAGADKLVDLLDKRSPTHGQAARILKLLLQPKVVTRSAYPLGRKPTISALLPFRFRFNTTMTCRMDILADRQDLQTPQFSTFTYVGTGPQVLVSPVAPEDCGKFSMELRFYYFLTPPSEGPQPYPTNPVTQFVCDLRDRISPPHRSSIPKKKWYQVGLSVPVDINVVPEAEAEQVQLLSSPELDNRMREALRADTPFWYLDMRIFARRLPANVVFTYYCELADGTRVRPLWPKNQHLTGYAGREFEVNLRLGDNRKDLARFREAKLVFEPDPNYAFEEPTIKSIWNGRLEFPVPPEPNAGE
jgi:hypothetical protein